MMSETSLVTNIDVKNTPKTRNSESAVIFPRRAANAAIGRSTFSRLKPSSTHSIIKSVPSVRQSISRRRLGVSGVMISEAAAASRESASIFSRIRKENSFFMGIHPCLKILRRFFKMQTARIRAARLF